MTDVVTPQQTIEDLAPWPVPGHTADALSRHLTVQAFAAHCRLHNHPCWKVPKEFDQSGEPAGAYAEALRGYSRDSELAWALYAAAVLSRRMDGSDDYPMDRSVPELACAVAEVASDTLTAWMAEYGIEPEVIVQAVRAERGLT